MLKEFREFAAKGNVVDMAVGIILGAAFGKIINSLVEDLLMPPLGLLLGKVDFGSLFIQLSGDRVASLAAAKAAGGPVIAYGAFLNQTVNFVIVAFAMFLLVKGINRLRAEPAPTVEAPPEPSGEEVLLAEIRDLLKQK